jgi:hypothetical protein
MVNNSTNIDQSRLISMNSLNTKKTVIYDIKYIVYFQDILSPPILCVFNQLNFRKYF